MASANTINDGRRHRVWRGSPSLALLVGRRIRQARALAEAELREAERRFRDMLAGIHLVAVILDVEARILYCNDFLLRLTGWSKDEVIGQDWFALAIPPELGEVKDEFWRILSGAASSPHVNEILTRSGTRRLVRWSNTVLRSPQGDVIGTASIGEDITEMRAAQEERRAAEAQVAAQLEELRTWHPATLGREDRVLELKREVNSLRRRLGEEAAYAEPDSPR